METNSAARWRRLVWISYGNAYLTGRATFDEWNSHRLLWDAVTLFRDAATRQLVAEDGFEWLWLLKTQGAQYLSLATQQSAPVIDGMLEVDAQLVHCHYADRIETWAAAREASTALRTFHQCHDSEAFFGKHIPDIDAYFLIASEPHAAKRAPVELPDWKKLQAEFDQTFGATQARRLPPRNKTPWFYAEYFAEPDWANLPTLPADDRLLGAHRLLQQLLSLRQQFDNDTHPKNEGNLYAYASAEAAEQLDHYAQALDHWLDRLQCAVSIWSGIAR
jgi:hypothetical protein